ncbi:MAG: hypothetical protein IH849_15300 [Acidobacteria bacterium]|nr:hypothetical protein [Acidobacteriota bacterium]
MVRARLANQRRGTFGEWGLLVLLGVASLLLFTPRLYGVDEIKYFAPLRSVYFDGDIHYENEYAYFIERDPVAHAGLVALRDQVTSTGRRLNDGPIGSALLWAPFYVAADGFVVVARWLGSDVPRDGFSWPYVWAVSFGSLFWGTIGLFLTYRLCREYADSNSSTAALIGIWFATPVVFYLYITPPMAHANSLFAVSLFLFIWIHTRDERQLWEWGILGASAGLMVLVRELNWLMLLAPVVDELGEAWDAYRVAGVDSALDSRGLFATWWNRFKSRAGGYAVAAVPMLLLVTLQLVVYRMLHGTFGPPPFIVDKFESLPIHAGEVLFSGFHGLFSWSPITLIGVLGLLALSARSGRVALALAVVFVVQVMIIGSYDTWWGGASFGARRFINCMPIFAIGLASLLTGLRSRAYRVAVGGIVVLILWNFGLAVQYSTGLIPRDQPVAMSTIVRNQFLEVPPRLAGIAWRFITDRSSFYHTRS